MYISYQNSVSAVSWDQLGNQFQSGRENRGKQDTVYIQDIKATNGTRKSHVKIENLYLKSTQVFIGGRYRF